MQKTRHYFPGGNTPKGFVSFYDEILKKDTTGKIAVIKGGPGTGKSTFMKRIGAQLESKGHMVDYLHCSSDPISLDGVFLPKYNSAIIDGTAPHIVDARYPASSDIVLNFCDFINEREMKKHSEEIKNLHLTISKNFSIAFDYLRAAEGIGDIMEKRSSESLDQREIINTAYNISKRVQDFANTNTQKHFFLSAITPLGLKNYLDFACMDRYIIKIDCQVGDAGHKILEKIISFCENSNVDMEIYHCPLKPSKPEHIIFPNAHTIITTANTYHNYPDADEVIYYNDFVKEDYNNAKDFLLYDSLIKNAIKSIKGAKKLHDALEKFYVNHFDFEKLKSMEERAVAFLTTADEPV